MSAPAACAFPLFRDRFLQPLAGGDGSGAPNRGFPASSAPASDPALSPTKAASRMGNLRVLDLRALPRDDGPPTELRARKEKLAHFERQCSRVGDGLYVGAEWVAKSREALAAAGITHVVNCVGFLYPPYFEAELAYQTLYLQDTPGEDILCVLYDVFDFIEAAIGGGSGGGSSGGTPGRVLVHCSQGVSRSATLAIAYLMWKQGATYDDVFQAVKAARGVANPNIGFICQLLQWHKRRHAPVDGCRLWRVAPQSTAAPQYLVAKAVASPRPTSLDPRGAFVLQGPASLAVWVGAACPEPFVAAAHRFAQQLQRYEGAPGPALVVRLGQEPEVFWASLAAAASEGSGSRAGSPAAPGSAAAANAAAAAAELVAAAAAGPVAVAESSAYDKDFELYARSLTARTSGDSGDSARSGGRKTPREEEAEPGAVSPNDRLRKQARGEERPPSPGKRRREPQWDLSLADLQPGISTDSAAAQLGKKERTLQEVTSPLALQRGHSSGDLPLLPSASASDGCMTPRSRGEEARAGQQLGGAGSHGRGAWQPQPSNLGRSSSGKGGDAAAAGADGAGQRRAVPRLALPARQ